MNYREACLTWALMLTMFLSSSAHQDEILVNTASGKVRGTMLTSRNGQPIYSFRGIPYAKPPVGNLRFRDPVPNERWEGVLDATREAPICVQKNYIVPNSQPEGQEDCLYLNVYTPQIRGNHHSKKLLPVMVFVHGGGWFFGSSRSDALGPQYLIDGGVILVTMNYRLGALGLLSTGCDAAPGNYAFKDQVLSLKWVKNNIENFGGDSKSVTIFGHSAGGASVHLLMISPLAKGLFHRAITQSGSGLNAWSKPEEIPYYTAQAQAKYLGAPADNWTSMEIVKFLRNVSAYELTNAGDYFKYWSIDPLTVFKPVVEFKTAVNPNPFLLNTPLEQTKLTGADIVPWMVGIVSNEGVIRGGAIYNNKTLLDDFNANMDDLGVKLMELENEPPTVWPSIREYFFGSSEVTEENKQKFYDLYSDRSFVHGIHKSIVIHSSEGNPSTQSGPYVYHMNYKGLYSYAPIYTGSLNDFGVVHADELIYLFRMQALFPDWPEGHPDIEMSKTLVELWTNFAKTGKPTRMTGSSRSWRTAYQKNVPFNGQEMRYLDISNRDPDVEEDSSEIVTRCKDIKLSMKSGLYTERMAFWDSLPLEDNKYGTVDSI